MADWMQGPYLYALYDSYGHSAQTIGCPNRINQYHPCTHGLSFACDFRQLFIAGFGTAALCCNSSPHSKHSNTSLSLSETVKLPPTLSHCRDNSPSSQKQHLRNIRFSP
eukprot:1393376-Amorphochlora_amoeboformis.AAC.2